VALAALIAAYHESAEPGVLRATLPLAGRTVIERQVRLAAAAGAATVVILVERMPAALTAAADRMRRERLPVQLVRNVEEAAEAVDPSDRLLLIADGAIAEQTQLARLADGKEPAVLTVADGVFGELHERIDAASRWAGLAAIDGAMLRDTAAMLRDWDLQSTLLRRALQAGARHVAVEGPVAILDSRADLVNLERQILASADEARSDWALRLLAPLERAVTRLLMTGSLGPSALGLAAVVMTALGAAAFASGWLRSGLALLLLATPLDGIAGRLSRLRMQGDVGRSWWTHLLPVTAGAAMIGLAYALAPTHGWGTVLLAFNTLAFLIALGLEIEGRDVRGAALLADWHGMIWLMLPFALLGLWQAGLAVLFAYAAASFFWAQREAHRMAAAHQD
jgi:hypothetical protein